MKQINFQNRIYEYDLDKKLGSGSFADVYKGKSCQDNSEIAVKVIQKKKLSKFGDKIYSAIGDEVNILQKLSQISATDPCPFIVHIYDCFSTENNIYIILEYCNNGNLQDILDKAPSKSILENTAVEIFFQIVFALKHLAKYEIAHRDIKPENVFINNGIYKLGDFGFAGQKGIYQTQLGTFPYMAPEFFNENSYDKEVDTWAAGVMFDQMLFGSLYFIGQTQMQVQHKILNTEYKVSNKIPISQNSADVLMKCLQKDKRKRITAQNLFAHPLFKEARSDPKIAKLINPKQAQSQQSKISHQKIMESLESARNALLMLGRFADTLQSKYLEQFRFQIFCLLKKGVNLMQVIYSSIEQGTAPNFIQQASEWQEFVSSNLYKQTMENWTKLKTNIVSSFQNYSSSLTNFIKQRVPAEQQQQYLYQYNNNLEQQIDKNLYHQSIVQVYQYFTMQIQRQFTSEQVILTGMSAVAINFEQCLLKQLVDFSNLEQILSKLNIQELQTFLEKIVQ